jgi:hypothetical protein
MDRTVPRTGSEEIELYMRTYYSLLRSTDTIQIETLVESHKGMKSLLHAHAEHQTPDPSALIYSSLRLPSDMRFAREVILGQTESSFFRAGWNVAQWSRVTAPARRRRTHFDGEHTLAMFIASRSDIDDLVPLLTAYQIEWNKLHHLLRAEAGQDFLKTSVAGVGLTNLEAEQLAAILQIEGTDVHRMARAWGNDFIPTLQHIGLAPKAMSLRLLAGSLMDYRRATSLWWQAIDDHMAHISMRLADRPVYFVSSNTHALPNLLSGYAQRNHTPIVEYLSVANQSKLLQEYEAIQRNEGQTTLNNFLYYVLKKYVSDGGEGRAAEILQEEESIGVHRIPSAHVFDVEAQVIELNRLQWDWLDPRLTESLDLAPLANSDALILNIDYPLGMAAYELLNRVGENVQLLGVYVMGKAATLNGRINDVMIPNVVHDEQSQNTYLFNNCFRAKDVAPYMRYGNVLDNQKAISVLGTFLQNSTYMGVFYKEGFTDIEMEAGPYLSSIYEGFRPRRHPFNEIQNLYGAPFDVGFLHYASDTPLSKGDNLSTNLSYPGVEPTYAVAIAILRRIFSQEIQRLRN